MSGWQQFVWPFVDVLIVAFVPVLAVPVLWLVVFLRRR